MSKLVDPHKRNTPTKFENDSFSFRQKKKNSVLVLVKRLRSVDSGGHSTPSMNSISMNFGD